MIWLRKERIHGFANPLFPEPDHGLLPLHAKALRLEDGGLKPFFGESTLSYERCHDDDVGWGILSWRSFGTLLMIISLDNVVQAGILVFIAFLMIAKGLPLYVATMATVVLLTGGVFGKAGCGYLADRIGVRPAFALVQVLTALGLIAVITAPVWLAFVLLLPLGVVAQGSTSITCGLIPDLIHPRRMARGYAVMYSSTSFAAALGPWLFGKTGDRYGINVAMLAMAGVALLAVPPIAFLPYFMRST